MKVFSLYAGFVGDRLEFRLRHPATHVYLDKDFRPAGGKQK